MDNGNIGDPRRRFLLTNLFLALEEDGNHLIDMDPDAASVERDAQGDILWEEEAGLRFNFKRPDFWPHVPGMWLARAQFWMEVAGIAAEQDMFAYMMDALPYKSLRGVHDLLIMSLAVRPFFILKEHLLLAT